MDNEKHNSLLRATHHLKEYIYWKYLSEENLDQEEYFPSAMYRKIAEEYEREFEKELKNLEVKK